MNELNEKKLHDCENFEKEFKKINIGENFIYSTNIGDFECLKIHEKLACARNIDDKLICFKSYANCLSIGAGYIPTYDNIQAINIDYELSRQR